MKIVNNDNRPAIPLKSLTIEFEADELVTLAMVIASVGGDPNKTRRLHTDTLSKMLSEYGYTPENIGKTAGHNHLIDYCAGRGYYYKDRLFEGSIYFHEYD